MCGHVERGNADLGRLACARHPGEQFGEHVAIADRFQRLGLFAFERLDCLGGRADRGEQTVDTEEREHRADQRRSQHDPQIGPVGLAG
jgi:hypothetical protein